MVMAPLLVATFVYGITKCVNVRKYSLLWVHFILNSIPDTTCDFETDTPSNCGYRTVANFDGLTWDRVYEKEIIGVIVHLDSLFKDAYTLLY